MLHSENWHSPRLQEDMDFVVNDVVIRYRPMASGSIDYRAVRSEGQLLGFLWASDSEDAANFAENLSAGDQGRNAGVYWYQQLRQMKRDGHSPSHALSVLAESPGDSDFGRVEEQQGRATSLGLLEVRQAASEDPGRPSSRADVVRGCLLAGAVGDALGAPVEFLTMMEIRERYGQHGLVDLKRAFGRLGAITDDTQMTLFTAEALVGSTDEHTRIVRLTEAYLRWLDTQEGGAPAGPGLRAVPALHSRRAPGNTCLSALVATRQGVTGSVNAPINDSKGCGGVMRAAPAGLVTASVTEAFRLGCDLAALTHGHPSGYLPAGVLAVLVHGVSRGGALRDALDDARRELRSHAGHEETLYALDSAAVLAERGRPRPEALESLGGGWTGEEALAIAVCVALSVPDLRTALLVAVNHSGDSDSTGSICGNLLGARDGVEAVPTNWLGALELREIITGVADALS